MSKVYIKRRYYGTYGSLQNFNESQEEKPKKKGFLKKVVKGAAIGAAGIYGGRKLARNIRKRAKKAGTLGTSKRAKAATSFMKGTHGIAKGAKRLKRRVVKGVKGMMDKNKKNKT